MPEDVRKGDILNPESGSIICCDCKIICGTIEVNESILTGESEPVLKREGDILLSGSSVISGRCSAEVICEIDDCFTSKITSELKTQGKMVPKCLWQ